METYICKNCGKEIHEVEFDNGYLQKFDNCKCGGHRISVPIDHYENYMIMKCPLCHKYPFGKPPISETKLAVVVLDVDENIEGIL